MVWALFPLSCHLLLLLSNYLMPKTTVLCVFADTFTGRNLANSRCKPLKVDLRYSVKKKKMTHGNAFVYVEHPLRALREPSENPGELDVHRLNFLTIRPNFG